MTERTPDEAKLDVLGARLEAAGALYDAVYDAVMSREAGADGPPFKPVFAAYSEALTAWSDEVNRQYPSIPTAPLSTYNGMPALTPHKPTTKADD